MLNSALKRSVFVVPQLNDSPDTTTRSGNTGTGPKLVVLNDDTDALLVRAAIDGERTAFQRLVERHLTRSVATARRLLGRDTNAEDVAQEAFVRLWHRLSDLEVGAAGVWPWLRRVIFNLCMDRRRARREMVPDALDMIASDDNQFRDLENQDLAARVSSALQGLPERQQAAIALFHYEGYSVKEIAETMESSPDAVESLLGRARRALKSELKNEWQDLLPGLEPTDANQRGSEEI